MYDPTSGDGWGHAFNVVLPAWTTDTTEPVIIDGTAKQFCHGSGFPQVLGPQDAIDMVQLVSADHQYRKYYARDRSVLNEP